MRLSILTPEALVVDREVRHVRAEDASGAFGIGGLGISTISGSSSGGALYCWTKLGVI